MTTAVGLPAAAGHDGDVGRRARIAILAAGFALLSTSIVHTAWLCDDAFITFRTADNILQGYGPVWNVGERVQAFTHPLWLALVLPAYAATRDPYAAVPIGAALTLGAVALLAAAVAHTSWQRLVCFAALLSSKAFIDYSTSGLENPLIYLLLTAFLWQWWEAPVGEQRTRRLACLASLCVLTRPDLAVIVGPALLADAYRLGPRVAVRPLCVGLLPLVAWEVFSLVYYGVPVPNTAYAKLNTGIDRGVLMQHGANYFKRTLTGDPVTLPVVALAPLTIAWRHWRHDWPIVAGLVVFCAYILAIGGDFMMGRFFTAPFCVSVALLARASWFRTARGGIVAAAACIVAGLLAPWEPALVSGAGYERLNNLLHGEWSSMPRDGHANLRIDGISDERRYYSSLAWLRTRGTISHVWASEGEALRRSGRRVAVAETIGLRGYFAGPAVHIIDQLALADPLLARLPAWPSSRIGHFGRDMPAGYQETIASGRNCLANSALAAYYDRLHRIVAGPIWSRRRLSTIAAAQFERAPSGDGRGAHAPSEDAGRAMCRPYESP